MATYTDDELKIIFEIVQKGEKARRINLHSPGSVDFVKNQLIHWLDGTQPLTKGYEKRFYQLFGTVDYTKPDKDVVFPSSIQQSQGSLDKLEGAWKAFQDALVSCIEEESEKRSQEKVKVLKDSYEKKLQDMQSILVEAQQSSLIGVLKKKFGSLS